MSISIFSVTKGGYALAKKLKTAYPDARLYVSKKIGNSGDYLMDGHMKACIQETFERDAAIVFIMATGIVVRMIAPLLKSKTKDPAVVVMDEKGDYVISLLSGHIGGGNDLAQELADFVGGQAVITTSSDVQQKIAVDVLAVRNNLLISSMVSAKDFASAVVNGEPLALVTEGQVQVVLDEQWRVNPSVVAPTEAVLYISNRVAKNQPLLTLIPRNIVLGIGCRRDTSAEKIKRAIESVFETLKLDIRSLRKIGTVDVKADEEGLIQAAAHYQVPLDIIARPSIKEIQDQFEGSDFVEKTIGVRAVCEPSALLASAKDGQFLMEKTAFNGITIAVWEESYEIR